MLAAALLGADTAFADGFQRAVEKASARVVKLYGLGAGAQKGYGTGVVVSEDGLVLTVMSLLIDARTPLAVGPDGNRYVASVVYRDDDLQLALVQLQRTDGANPTRPDSSEAPHPPGVGPLPYFDLAREAPLRPGDWVIAAGNAFKVADGAEPVSIAHGVFSGRTRLDASWRARDFPFRGDVLVIDAITSNPGAPGSALVDIDGEMVGLIGRTVISNLTHTHFNYALPREVLHSFLTEARSRSDSERPPSAKRASEPADEREVTDVGIRLVRTGYRNVLPFVERVQRDSPAARAGVRKDDLILSVNGRAVPDAETYDDLLEMLAPDQPVELVIRRKRTIKTIVVEAPPK